MASERRQKFLKLFFIANDLVWLATAVAYMCVDEPSPWMNAGVVATTAVYAFDLGLKLKAMDWKLGQFMKKHWLDVLFLIPFVKLFRGMRIFKAGRMLAKALVASDMLNDLSEIAFRCYAAVKKCRRGM